MNVHYPVNNPLSGGNRSNILTGNRNIKLYQPNWAFFLRITMTGEFTAVECAPPLTFTIEEIPL